MGYQPAVATVSGIFSAADFTQYIGVPNISSEVSWSTRYPFSSSLTHQTPAQLAAAYHAATKQQWIPHLGFAHALFEVAAAALTKARALSRPGIAAAIATLRANTIAGPLNWNSGPVKNVATTPLVGGQWRKAVGTYELVIVANKHHPSIPAAGHMEPISRPPSAGGC